MPVTLRLTVLVTGPSCLAARRVLYCPVVVVLAGLVMTFACELGRRLGVRVLTTLTPPERSVG